MDIFSFFDSLYRFVIFCSSKSSKQLEVHVLTRFYITLFTIFSELKICIRTSFICGVSKREFWISLLFVIKINKTYLDCHHLWIMKLIMKFFRFKVDFKLWIILLTFFRSLSNPPTFEWWKTSFQLCIFISGTEIRHWDWPVFRSHQGWQRRNREPWSWSPTRASTLKKRFKIKFGNF